MISITFATYDDTPPLGGQGVMLGGLRAALQERGARVRTVAGRGDHAVPFPRVTGRRPLDLSLHLNRHPELLLDPPPDLVHANGGPGGVILLRRLPVPLVYTAHHTYAQAHPRWSAYRLPSPLEARSYRRAAMVLAVSSTTAAAVRLLGVAASRIAVVPPGVELPEEGEHEPGRVLFLGRLEPNKGVLDAVAVMLALVRTLPGVRGVIVGDGSLMPKVRARVAGESHIEIRGALDADAARREYGRAALLLMPSRYEGLGLAALEAQAAATPVVGYAVSGLTDAVREGGVLVPPGDMAGLRDAAVQLLRVDARRRELGERGREFVRTHHSWPAVARRVLDAYAAVRDAA